MKLIPLVFLAAITCAAHVFSQDEKAPEPTTARILGTIPDGTPPPPEEPKPGFVVRSRNILKTETHQQGGRTITLQQIDPIQLPPPPAEAPPVNIADPDIQQRIGEGRENAPNAEFIFVSASVFHAKDSPPRTLVTLWPHGRGESITFWSSADFALLSGFSSFVGSDGMERSLIMAWSPHEIETINELTGDAAGKYGLPKIPELPAGAANYSITSGKPDPTTLTAIQSLHVLYNNEHGKLKAAYEGREKARLQHEAELKANPPKPKNIVLNYWRIGDAKPATNISQQGGAK